MSLAEIKCEQIDFKRCSKCSEEKNLCEFHKDRTKKDGISTSCKTCCQKKMQAYTRNIISVEYKKCRDCSELKQSSEFHKNKMYADGLSNICKLCRKIVAKIHNDKRKFLPKKFVEIKRCNTCSELKSYKEYNKCITSEDNLQVFCKECQSKIDDKYRKKYPYKKTARANKRRSSLIKATPKWLTEQDNKKMDFMYHFAKSIDGFHGNLYHVDHIHPLNNKKFSGLNVPWNLQILSAEDNVKKGNKPPEDESHLCWEETKPIMQMPDDQVAQALEIAKDK